MFMHMRAVFLSSVIHVSCWQSSQHAIWSFSLSRWIQKDPMFLSVVTLTSPVVFCLLFSCNHDQGAAGGFVCGLSCTSPFYVMVTIKYGECPRWVLTFHGMHAWFASEWLSLVYVLSDSANYVNKEYLLLLGCWPCEKRSQSSVF